MVERGTIAEYPGLGQPGKQSQANTDTFSIHLQMQTFQLDLKPVSAFLSYTLVHS